MPNHCNNRVEIHCKTVEQAKEIVELTETIDQVIQMNKE